VGRNFLHLCEEMVARCEKSDFEFFGVTVRNIWLRRNSVVHGGEFVHPTQLVSAACKAPRDFQRANSRRKEERRPNMAQQRAPWQSPPNTMIKIN
jgi:hypothetical protein